MIFKSKKLKLPKHYKPIDVCPFCGGKLYMDHRTPTIYSSKDFNDDNSKFTVVHHCMKCNKLWKDIYMYAATILLDGPDRRL